MMSSISKYQNSFMTVLMLVIFITFVSIATRYPAGARFMPFVLGFPAIALCLLQLFLDARDRSRANKPMSTPASDAEKIAEQQMSKAVGHDVHFDVPVEAPVEDVLEPREQIRREAIAWAYFLGLILGIILFGFHLAIPVFLVSFLRYRADCSWRFTILLTAGVTVFLFAVFEYALHISLHTGFITDRIMDALGFG